jgi:HK97 gp10 family phage protein
MGLEVKTNNMDGFDAKFNAAVNAGLDAMGLRAADAIRRVVGTEGNARKINGRWVGSSPPGNAPGNRRGGAGLRGSITHRTDTSNLSVTVGSNLKYARYLELGTSIMSPRPFISKTVRNNYKKLQDAFKKSFERGMQ